MINIICIKWGNKYSDEYVDKLYAGIKRNTSKSFLFTCYTDRCDKAYAISTERIFKPLPFNTGDWYSKIGLFNKDLYWPCDQVFYFDLDTVITGNLDKILEYEGDFAILRDFYRPKGYGSGFMSFAPDAVNHMWTNFTRGYTNRYGDQGWCEEQYPNADIWQDMYPGKVISYKVHIRDKGIQRHNYYTQDKGNLKSSSIVCFHGRPNPHDIKEDWIKDHWI